MNRSPPIPLTYGWTTPITAFAAIAASMAFPPCSRMGAPACDARNCGAATMPNFVTTMERPWPGTEENSWPTNIEEIDRTNADASVTTFMPFSFAQSGCDTGHLNRIVSIWKFHPTACEIALSAIIGYSIRCHRGYFCPPACDGCLSYRGTAGVVDSAEGMWMLGRGMVAIALGLLVCVGCGRAQDVGELPGATRVVRTPEVSVNGLVRRDANTVAFTATGKALGTNAVELAGPELLVHDFAFNGEPVTTDKLHLRQVAPGVVEITSVAWEVDYWRFQVRDAASYYGLGERFDTLDHAHTVVKNLSMDNAGVKGTSTYKPIPFFMSTSGYGMWVDTTGEATFDMNASDRDEIVVDATTARLRIVLFTGPEFPGILEKFTALAGRAILPPYWAFAPWKARDYHQNDAQVKEDVDRTRELGLPASVIVIDSPWATTYNDYKFNPKQFADAPAMVKYVHAQGYKLVLWHTPWINSKSDAPKEAGFEGKIAPLAENYQFAADQGLFVKNRNGSPYVGRWWKGQGSMIDFTNPKAKQWGQDQVRQAIAAGADGFKDDDAEGNFFGADVKFADGTDPRVMRNRYSVLYNNAMEELIQKDLNGNGVLFARSATVGANGIGFLWGGDNRSEERRVGKEC